MSMVENKGADPGQWEVLAGKRGYDVEKALYALPAFRDTFVRDYPDAPVFMVDMPWRWLACPKGHRVLGVELNVDHNWHLTLVPREQETSVPADGQTVVGATWTRMPAEQRTSVCAEPGCPSLVKGRTHCLAHAPVPATVENELHETRVRITCPQPGCGYSRAHLHRKLLVDFALAVVTTRRTMRLPGGKRSLR